MLSEEAMKRMGLDVADMGPQPPSERRLHASENSTKQIATFRRTKSTGFNNSVNSGIAKMQLANALAAKDKLARAAPSREKHRKEERRTAHERFQDSCSSSFRKEREDEMPSTLEEKVARMKELSMAFRRSNSQRLLHEKATCQMESETPALRRTGAKSA